MDSGTNTFSWMTEDRRQRTEFLPSPSSIFWHPKVGFPIRKFTDQSLFAAPRDLSQRTTSFVASQRQGIHRIPLRHLSALIIDAHPARQRRTRAYSNASLGPDHERPVCFKHTRERCGQQRALIKALARRRPPEQSDVFPLHDVR